MYQERDVQVHLLPHLVSAEALSGGLAVVVDVLRATTTVVFALAAGCEAVLPCGEVDEAKTLADGMRVDRVLLAGERDGQPIVGFDLGNSPRDYKSEMCDGKTLVFTTSNGTRALLHATKADRVVTGAFVNFSAVCEQLRDETRPIHIICAGTDGEISLEDALLAGAFVEYLCDLGEVDLNDSARLAWDCFENHGGMLREALELSQGGAVLRRLGYDEDIDAAAQVDRFTFVPELRRDPLRIEIGAVGIANRHWMK